ncbi:hypothetical protein HMPREF2820_06930 [Corynebacterium sp. HMSC064E08]|nr:hypothetical protein HMPREF2820_06930 [Corynebacterium sp. HMSC064E08]
MPKSCPSGADVGSELVVVDDEDVVLGVDDEDDVDVLDVLDVLDDVSEDFDVVVVVVVVLLVEVELVEDGGVELDDVGCEEEGTSGRWGSSLLFSDRPMAMPMTTTSAVATMMMGMLRDLGVPLPDMPIIIADFLKM